MPFLNIFWIILGYFFSVQDNAIVYVTWLPVLKENNRCVFQFKLLCCQSPQWVTTESLLLFCRLHRLWTLCSFSFISELEILSIWILHQSLPSKKCEGRSLTSNQKVDLISYIITNLTLYCILVSLKTVVTFFLIYLLPFQNTWTLCEPNRGKTFKNNCSIRVHYAMPRGSAQKSCAEKTFNLYFFQYIIS